MQGYNCIIIYNQAADGLLFCQRQNDPYKGKFNLVGGKIEVTAGKTEDGFHAAYRELEEETGITRDDIQLTHMMDFTYYNQDCYVEVYCGQLRHEVELKEENHPLHWLPLDENFFDLEKFAGEGNIGHMIEQVNEYGKGIADIKTRISDDKADPRWNDTGIGGYSLGGAISGGGFNLGAAIRAGGKKPAAKTTGASGAPSRKSKGDHPYSILCYGDSNTYGYNPLTGMRYSSDIRWTGVLAKLLGDEYKVIEEGCNGRTAAAVDPDEEWKNGMLTLKPVLNTHKPLDMMILKLGVNDLKKHFNMTPDKVADGVKKLIETTIEFTREKQGFMPEILVVSPALIGIEIESSAFGDSFDAAAIDMSAELAAKLQNTVSSLNSDAAIHGDGGRRIHFMNAADYIQPSKADSLHLMPDAHDKLAHEIDQKIRQIIGNF